MVKLSFFFSIIERTDPFCRATLLSFAKFLYPTYYLLLVPKRRGSKMDLTNMLRVESQFPHISHYLDTVAVVPYLTRGESNVRNFQV